jgi:hypothetical protein
MMTLVCIATVAPLEMNTEILIPETTGLKKQEQPTKKHWGNWGRRRMRTR